jgi:chromosome segregation ATPase
MYVYTIGFHEMVEEVAQAPVSASRLADGATSRATLIGSILLAWNKVSENLQATDFSGDIQLVMQENTNAREDLSRAKHELQTAQLLAVELRLTIQELNTKIEEKKEALRRQLLQTHEAVEMSTQHESTERELRATIKLGDANFAAKEAECSELYQKIRSLQESMKKKEEELLDMQSTVRKLSKDIQLKLAVAKAELEEQKVHYESALLDLQNKLKVDQQGRDELFARYGEMVSTHESTLAELTQKDHEASRMRADWTRERNEFETRIAELTKRAEQAEANEDEAAKAMQDMHAESLHWSTYKVGFWVVLHQNTAVAVLCHADLTVGGDA